MGTTHRVGFGFDSHLFSKTGILVLGGVRFATLRSLKGHSDGDALLHAVIDALLGAAGLGDIGDFFPDTAKQFKGVSSLLLLQKVAGHLKKVKAKPIHIDITVLADKPRLKEAKDRIKGKIARALNIPRQAVNIKAKTQEGLTIFKKPGGIAVWTVATVR